MIQKQALESVIMGIDPGTNVLGYGAIRVVGQKISLVGMGVVRMEKLTNQQLKLKTIFSRVLELIDEYKPDELAIEAPFFGKNVQSMLKLGRAQGVAMAAALYRNIPVIEYSPRKIKQSITGNGSCSKEQVAYMIKNMLHLEESPKFLDATDAIGVAICHHFQAKGLGTQEKHTGWDAYLKNNPDKLAK
ncbi:MAG: crossover junction endodeoxyribonuclease RuvC [Bacteroidota bacterium]